VGGDYGHLSNTAAAAIAGAVMHQGLKHLVAAHLSAQNNQADIVRALLAETILCSTNQIVIATQDEGTAWLEI